MIIIDTDYKMKNSKKLLFTIGLIIGVIFISCKKETEKVKKIETSRVESLPFYEEATFTPKWIKPGSKELESFHKIPDFKLINQLGDTITNETFKNKIYITDFFFTTCSGICPKMTTNMIKLQEAFKEDNNIMLLSHSVTPKFDKVPVLREYANNKGVNVTKWHLVTGDREHIYNLGRNSYFVEEDLGKEKKPEDFLHTENFVLIDQDRHIRGIYNGIHNASVRQLITDVKELKKELKN